MIMMNWHGNGAMSGWGWGLTTISMILFLGLLVAAGIALYRHFDRGAQPRIPPAATAPQTPEQILAERYARGEIDENEYTTRLATVRNHDRHSVR
jgi:putative membrane protein